MAQTFRPALWPTLFTIPAIITLLGLGTWQVQRMTWKNDVIARIEQRLSAAPVEKRNAALQEKFAQQRETFAARMRFERFSGTVVRQLPSAA